ncbi:MAG: carboxypeptidase regulatory-like domain-containing protein [Trueperaceae bacterium]|nr:carboxypeptidase regulatory-like domain-containing protein [Trueperaceae bacterium]
MTTHHSKHHLKTIRQLLLTLVPLLLLLTACPGMENGGEPSTGSVSGRVVDTDGNDISSVTVNINGNEVQSNEQGFYSISGVSVGSKLATFSASGFATTQERFEVIEDRSSFLETVMLAVDVQGSVDAAAGGEVFSSDGRGGVRIDANTVVDENGNAYSGTVNVDIAMLDPSNPSDLDSFPGDFSARDQNDQEGSLESFGAMNVELSDDNGNALDIASGETSGITIPIPPADVDRAPDTIPLFSYDTEQGVWVEESSATKTQLSNGSFAYVGLVDSYSWWNADVLYEQSFLTGRVVTSNGDPVPGARVKSRGQDYNGLGETTSQSDGTFRVPARPNSEVVVEATAGAGTATTNTINTPGEGEETDIGDIVIEAPVLQISLSWGETPSDLDSHFTGPLEAGGRFHVYYVNQGSLSQSPYAQLDTDDTTSFGPEVITVTRVFNGVYRYSVHDFSNRNASQSRALAESGATVEVRVDGVVVDTYNVPDQEGTLWTVFDFENGNVTPIDTVSYEAPPADVNASALQGLQALPAKR